MNVYLFHDEMCFCIDIFVFEDNFSSILSLTLLQVSHSKLDVIDTFKRLKLKMFSTF